MVDYLVFHGKLDSRSNILCLIYLCSYSRKSVTSFFAAYDALCEEGTAVPVCKALDEVADISVPGTVDV